MEYEFYSDDELDELPQDVKDRLSEIGRKLSRLDFPAVDHHIPLPETWNTYLDSAATTQIPRNSPNEVLDFFDHYNANPGKGVYYLSSRAEQTREMAREHLARFCSVSPEELAYTSGATASLNMLALGLKHLVKKGDEIVVSIYEHHSNFLPWVRLAKEAGAELKILYDFSDEELEKITDKTKIVAVTGESNVLGLQPPLKRIAKKAHEHQALVVADLSQYLPHALVNLRDLDVDFAVFSAHKFYGPMGLGVLYAKKDKIDLLEPTFLGGGMVEEVSEDGFTPVEGIKKLEAGTPNMPGIILFDESLWEFTEEVLAEWLNRSQRMTADLKRRLEELPNLEIYGVENGIAAFNLRGVHPHDVGTLLDEKKIEIRTGKHCAEPLINWLAEQKIGGGPLYPTLNEFRSCCRVSLGVYNDASDLDRLLAALKDIKL